MTLLPGEIYPEKTIIQRGTCTAVIIVALFTVARTWEQPKCPSTDKWTKSLQTVNAGEGVEKRKPCPVGGNGRQYGDSLKK